MKTLFVFLLLGKSRPLSAWMEVEPQTAMPNVHANPDQIEQFATSLAIFGQNVREELVRIHTAFSQLCETWIDDAHQRYSQQFEEMVPPISRLMEVTPDHVMHLLRKAEELRAYLGR